jgi:hypothetical protein
VRKLAATLIAGALLIAASNGANVQARIFCVKGFQQIQGSWLATPYCQDELIAEVARQYGMKASVQAIRSNPNFKREVCRLIGQDIRVKQNCDEANPSENDLP